MVSANGRYQAKSGTVDNYALWQLPHAEKLLLNMAIIPVASGGYEKRLKPSTFQFDLLLFIKLRIKAKIEQYL